MNPKLRRTSPSSLKAGASFIQKQIEMNEISFESLFSDLTKLTKTSFLWKAPKENYRTVLRLFKDVHRVKINKEPTEEVLTKIYSWEAAQKLKNEFARLLRDPRIQELTNCCPYNTFLARTFQICRRYLRKQRKEPKGLWQFFYSTFRRLLCATGRKSLQNLQGINV